MSQDEKIILNKRYELLAQLGAGGMSVIYKARDISLGRPVAVKTLRTNYVSDISFVERFQNEARAIARLKHANIVTVYDVGTHPTPNGNLYYIVMELVEGRDLKKLIKEAPNNLLPLDRALDLMLQVCYGIGYAHRSSLVHADIKPQNIMVTPAYEAIVTDFGIAQILSNTQPMRKSDIVWGSPHYFSPEQAQGDPPSPKSDVYSMGIVLFELLTGKLPYSGTSPSELGMAHIKERIPRVTELNPHVPEELANIVYKAMSKQPEARFRDGDQFGEVLRTLRERLNKSTIPLSEAPAASANPPRPATPAPAQPVVPSVPTMPSGTPNVTVPASPAPYPPPARMGQNLPPTIPPAPPSEPTSRYSPAPVAPNPYRPSAQVPFGAPSLPNQTPNYPPQAMPQGYGNPVSAPQPLEQRYMPPAGQGLRQPGDSLLYSAQYPAQVPDADDDSLDYVTISLAVLAVIAVLGLFPVWILALMSR